MSVNKHQPHILVLPEDDANRQLANGFLLEESVSVRQIQVLEVAGGWMKVRDRFESDHVRAMKKCPQRYMVLLVDFDGKSDRLQDMKSSIPPDLIDRVLVLGVWKEPESLKAKLGRTYEQIGRELAKECREEGEATWGNELLRHNAGEIDRLRDQIRPILFQSM
jgi:hypothetical protein